MITLSDILSLTSRVTYQKAMDIYTTKRIVSYERTTSGEGYVQIYASVLGHYSDYYSIRMRIREMDKERDEVYDQECDCPAFANSSMCKHCLAVLIRYSREQSFGQTDTKKTAIDKLAGIQKGIRQKTTPGMKRLIEDRMRTSTVSLIDSQIFGRVHLEPILEYETSEMYLSFKIGVEKMYILKDLSLFGELLLRHEFYEYGKNLRFLHVKEAFDEPSRKMVRFIQMMLQECRRRSAYPMSYGFNSGLYTMPKVRSLHLNGRDLEDFLDVIGEQPVTISNGNRISLDESTIGNRRWRVADEPFQRHLQLIGEHNGLRVICPRPVGFAGRTCNIYLRDGLIFKVDKDEVDQIQSFLDGMSQVSGQVAFIETEEVPMFCKYVLPMLKKGYQIEAENFDENQYVVARPKYEFYLDAPQKDMITCGLYAVYGEEKCNVYDSGIHHEVRNREDEIVVIKAVESMFNAFDERENVLVLANDDDRLYELLVYGITKMSELGEVYVSETMKRMKIRQSPKISVGVSMSGNLLELSLLADGMSKEELISVLSKYSKKRKFVRLKNGDFLNASGEDLEAVIALQQGLQLTDKQLLADTVSIPKFRALFLDAELREHGSVAMVKDKSFKALVRNMKTVEDNDFELPPDLERILREYQKRGFLWLKTLKNNGFGGILADDMGLGKTLQVISFLLSEFRERKEVENRRCLIVMPASLVYNWKSELERFAPELPVQMIIGNSAERKKMIQESGEAMILLTSYDLLKRDIKEYENKSFFAQIIDEAQYIKNHGTQAAHAVKEIHAEVKLALTGTPVENRLSELWSIFDYLMPGFLFSYAKFRERFELPIVQNQEEDAGAQLQKLIRPFVLRRLKRDVLTDLPDKLEENIYAQLGGEQQKLYDAHVSRVTMMLNQKTDEEVKENKIQILAELTKLRQICCNPAILFEDYRGESAKTELCINMLQNAISSGHKVLLFSQFTSMLQSLQERMAQEGITFYTLTGATSKEKRAQLVEAFQQDDTSVFCISLKAGGTGLNLTAADIVIHYDPWWNVAVQNQATDRAHRIGQTNVVNVYKLIVKGTIEEKIIELQEKKQELADQILGGEGLQMGSFNKEELLGLLCQ